MSQGILLFDNDNGGGGSSSTFDNTSFVDTVLPASNNTGYSSTVGRNPLNGNFANDLAPKWLSKTLYIKDIVRVEDKSLWVNNKPTYRIIWNEDFPGANGYLFGDISGVGSGETKYYQLLSNGDGLGVTGVIRRVMWIVRPSNTTTNAQQYLDGSSTTTIQISGISATSNIFNYPTRTFFSRYVHAAANETHDIHDYRLTALKASALNVAGVVVYYDIAGDGIEVFPGVGYVNKTQVTAIGSSLAYPDGASNFLGGVAGLYLSPQGSVGITHLLIPSSGSSAFGNSGTNLLSLSTGTGSSFPIGSAVFVSSGSTGYVGGVSNVSGDVLTVFPTLGFNLNGSINQLFKYGATQVIGSTVFTPSLDWQPGAQNRGIGASGLPFPDLNTSFSARNLDWRIWGFTHQFMTGSSLSAGFSTFGDGLSGFTLGLVSQGVSSFLQIDGKYCALEMEFALGVTATLAASFVIDGFINYSISEGASLVPGLVRRTVMTDAGYGQHSVRVNLAGCTNAMLTRITGYKPNILASATLGVLAEIPISQTFMLRYSSIGSTVVQNGITTLAFGNVSRMYADNLVSTSGWGYLSGIDDSYAPGGAWLASQNLGDTISFQYFGTQFCIIGNPGASSSISVDGTPIAGGGSFNIWMGSGLTLGFHSVIITSSSNAATTTIGAVDYLTPYAEVRNLANYTPFVGFSSLVKSTISMSEPLNSRTGDIWVQSESNSVAYQRAFGGWQRMALNQPFCSYGASAIQKLVPGGATNYLIFDYKISDGFSMGNSATGSTFFTIPSNGNYLVQCQVRIQEAGSSAGFGTSRNLQVGAGSGSSFIYFASSFGVSTTNSVLLSGSNISYFTKGQQISTNLFHGSGVTLATAGGPDGTFFNIQRIGP